MTTSTISALLAPGMPISEDALIIASAPAKSTMPRHIVLALNEHREYVTWEVSVLLPHPFKDAGAGGMECGECGDDEDLHRPLVAPYWGEYFPLGEIADAVASFARRTGTLDNLRDAVESAG